MLSSGHSSAAALRVPTRVPRLLSFLLALALPLLLVASAPAQSTRVVLRLLVIDGTSGAPISGVQVIVDGGRRGLLSGSDGMAEIPTTLGDSVDVELRMVGYQARRLSAYPTPGAPLLITIPLELAPVTLAPVRVRLEGATRSRELQEFYRRARTGPGQYLTRADIARRRPRDLADLFRNLPGISLSNTAFGESPVMEAKGSMIPDRGSTDCDVQYFLDGTPIRPPEGAIGFDVDLSEVEGIEIYRRGTGVPARFQRQHGACGVILIWKRESLEG